MRCLGIIWNSVQNFTADIKDDVELYSSIEDIFQIDLGEDYEQFVRDIYSHDDIAKWKVDKKIETMFQCTNSRKVAILIMNIDESLKYYHELKKRMVFQNIEKMKTDIRKKYSLFIENYFFDNIFHVTDDEFEYENDLETINQYLTKYSKEPFVSNCGIQKVKKNEFRK